MPEMFEDWKTFSDAELLLLEKNGCLYSGGHGGWAYDLKMFVEIEAPNVLRPKASGILEQGCSPDCARAQHGFDFHASWCPLSKNYFKVATEVSTETEVPDYRTKGDLLAVAVRDSVADKIAQMKKEIAAYEEAR